MFDTSGFTTIAPTLHRYTTTQDDVHQVAAPGFFDPAADQLADGDVILVVADAPLVLFAAVVDGRVWTRRPFAGRLFYGQSASAHADIARSRQVPPTPPAHPPATAVEGAGGAGAAAKQP